MKEPKTLTELAVLFGEGWRIKNLRVDGRGDTQHVYIELERAK
jgi:hypothetical protein